jgi:aspartyl-tRNA synthetase
MWLIIRRSANGPSKSELKKRAKAAEKEKKAAEKLAKQQEIANQQAASQEPVSFLSSPFTPNPISSIRTLPSTSTEFYL